MDRWSRKQSVTGYWILGLHWGKALSNNHKGHLVGHVKDLGLDLNKAETRLYATSAAQPYHTDGADIVTLLCLKEARVGGKSRWASSWAIHNEFLKLRPDLGPVMAGPWYIDRKGEVPTGQKPYFALPPFNYHEVRSYKDTNHCWMLLKHTVDYSEDEFLYGFILVLVIDCSTVRPKAINLPIKNLQGYLSVNWAPHFYESVHRHEGVPPFSKEHQEVCLGKMAWEESSTWDSGSTQLAFCQCTWWRCLQLCAVVPWFSSSHQSLNPLGIQTVQ